MNKLEVKSEVINQAGNRNTGRAFPRTIFMAGVLGLLLTAGWACGGEPTVAECGRYYSHISRLQQSGHGAVSAALRTAAGKDAVINYCLRLPRYQIDCTLQAGSLANAQACESSRPKSLIDQYKDYLK